MLCKPLGETLGETLRIWAGKSAEGGGEVTIRRKCALGSQVAVALREALDRQPVSPVWGQRQDDGSLG